MKSPKTALSFLSSTWEPETAFMCNLDWKGPWHGFPLMGHPYISWNSCRQGSRERDKKKGGRGGGGWLAQGAVGYNKCCKQQCKEFSGPTASFGNFAHNKGKCTSKWWSSSIINIFFLFSSFTCIKNVLSIPLFKAISMFFNWLIKITLFIIIIVVVHQYSILLMSPYCYYFTKKMLL